MASLPNPNQVAGKNAAIYEAYYKQVDPKGLGAIEALVAAKFLKKTGLSDVVLSRIWDFSDPTGKGYLDKSGVFVALKLVALAQEGNDISMRNIFNETANPPKVGEIPKILPQSIQNIPPTSTDWTLKQSDRDRYEQLYQSLMPVNGLIPGNKVKGVLMDSKLPLETLGKIWDLADQDKDGSLDRHEFTVAMHLVYQALDKRAIPTVLPIELQRPKEHDFTMNGDFVANFPKEMLPPAVPPLPAVVSNVPPPLPRHPPTIPSVPSMPLIEADLLPPMQPNQPVGSDWVVTPLEKIRYDAIFVASDLDNDGLVSGFEIKDVFLKSGVPQACLAHIWALCDTNQSGKLTSDQFALAMWFVERKKNGIEPPQVLAPNMIPPSVRPPGVDIVAGATAASIQMDPPQPAYSNPELEMISKEIEELAKERRILETDVAQKEADIRIKNGEVRSLQSELDTLAATLKQLENQKGEAQKRLDDLKAQVNKIRDQCQKQESTIKDQETELESKRSELQKLKDEESSLEHEYDSSLKELDGLTGKLQDTQLQISQIKAMVSQLQESQRQMNDALAMCKTAIEESDPTMISDYSLKLEPDYKEALQVLEVKPERVAFNDTHNTTNGFKSDPFKSNGFSSDPFNKTAQPGGFATNFNSASSATGGGFDDAFGDSFDHHAKQHDPFAANTHDPFEDKAAKSTVPDSSKDEFGSDPFAILHAPTSSSQLSTKTSGPPPRPESPSPALPPKKAKQPPPRPAPPRPLAAPTGMKPTTSQNSFMDNSSDFADFDMKKMADFSEDPFKDYRYEDPFSIQDPFADEVLEVTDPFDETSKVINNKLNDNKTTKTKNTNNTMGKQNHLPSFPPPPPPSSSSSLPRSASTYAAVPSNTDNNLKTDNNAISNDLFANFDAFTISSNNNAAAAAASPPSAINKSSSSDFFDAFNDNFEKQSNKEKDMFDAFGDANFTSKSTKSKFNNFTSDYDAFNDNFADDKFTKFDLSPTPTKKTSEINFAKFDFTPAPSNGSNSKFDNQHIASNNSRSNKNNNININRNNLKENANDNAKACDRFEQDYSKGETFQDDLDAVLKRSMLEQ